MIIMSSILLLTGNLRYCDMTHNNFFSILSILITDTSSESLFAHNSSHQF